MLRNELSSHKQSYSKLGYTPCPSLQKENHDVLRSKQKGLLSISSHQHRYFRYEGDMLYMLETSTAEDSIHFCLHKASVTNMQILHFPWDKINLEDS